MRLRLCCPSLAESLLSQGRAPEPQWLSPWLVYLGVSFANVRTKLTTCQRSSSVILFSPAGMIPVIPFEIFQNTSPSVIATIRSLLEMSAGFLRNFARLASLPDPVSPWQKTQLPVFEK